MKTHVYLCAAIALTDLSGCATFAPSSTAAAAKNVPVSATMSPATTETPATVTPPTEPDSVYRNPKVGVVYLRAYQDAAGRLFGPQVMYQVTEPGAWNLDALDRSSRIADTNIESSPRSVVIAPARDAPEIPKNSPLLDADKAAQIVLTGLMRQEDQTQAEAMARQAGDRIAMFDTEAGWLLMPSDTSKAP